MSQNDARKGQETPVSTRSQPHRALADALSRDCVESSLRREHVRAIHDMVASDQYDPPADLIAERMIDDAISAKGTRSK